MTSWFCKQIVVFQICSKAFIVQRYDQIRRKFWSSIRKIQQFESENRFSFCIHTHTGFGCMQQATTQIDSLNISNGYTSALNTFHSSNVRQAKQSKTKWTNQIGALRHNYSDDSCELFHLTIFGFCFSAEIWNTNQKRILHIVNGSRVTLLCCCCFCFEENFLAHIMNVEHLCECANQMLTANIYSWHIRPNIFQTKIENYTSICFDFYRFLFKIFYYSSYCISAWHTCVNVSVLFYILYKILTTFKTF